VTRDRQRLIIGRPSAKEEGFFDAHWRLPPRAATAAAPPIPTEGDDGPTEGMLHTEPPLDTTFVPLWPVLPVRGVIAPPGPPATFAAADHDEAGVAARAIAAAVPTFHNYRGDIAGARWTGDAEAWQVRNAAACLAALHDAGVPAHVYADPTRPLRTPVPTAVELDGPVGGIAFRDHDAPIRISCELALKLPRIAEILTHHDIVAVDVTSSYRDRPRESFHTFGMALDLGRFEKRDGTLLVVTRDAQGTPGAETCDAPPPRAPRARELRVIACELAATHAFETVLTPNYNTGHRSHFHVDVRPDDTRTFVR
jgi:hypothetical protein